MRRSATILAVMGIALAVCAGAAFAATLECTAGRGCVGTDGPDTLNGSTGSDDIDGRQAGDQLFGNEGHDWISGDAYAAADTTTDGDDSISGGSESDGMAGFGGSDLLSGGSGSDYIDAVERSRNPGEDTVQGNGGNDFIDAIDGSPDAIDCGAGRRDRVYYDRGLDTIQRCEVARTTRPVEFFAAAGEGETERAR